MPNPGSTTDAPTVSEYLDYLEQATVYFWDEYGSFSAEQERRLPPRREACAAPSFTRHRGR